MKSGLHAQEEDDWYITVDSTYSAVNDLQQYCHEASIAITATNGCMTVMGYGVTTISIM